MKPGSRFTLTFDLKSVPGLRQATLVGSGTPVATRKWDDAPRETIVEFPLQTDAPTWYAIVVEDAAGRRAYSNPIWIDTIAAPPASGAR